MRCVQLHFPLSVFPMVLKPTGYPALILGQKLSSASPIGYRPHLSLQYCLANCIFSLLYHVLNTPPSRSGSWGDYLKGPRDCVPVSIFIVYHAL